MRVGIISDIHGGLHEFEVALQQLRAADVDHIVCAGDLVDFGLFSDEVVQRIFDEDILCVQGNHDRMARDNQCIRHRRNEHDQSIMPLQSHTLDLLDQLPIHLRFEWHNIKILLTHSVPWEEDMYVYPQSTTYLMRRIAREADANVIILGHTHQPMWIEIDGIMIINPGSVSQNYELGFGTYGIFTLPNRTFQLFNVMTGEQTPLAIDKR